MRRVSVADIKQMNDIYYKCHNYSEVARQTGWSAATVKAYIDKNYKPEEECNIRRFDPNVDIPKSFSTEIFKGVKDFGSLCVLSKQEIDEIKVLWEELSL